MAEHKRNRPGVDSEAASKNGWRATCHVTGTADVTALDAAEWERCMEFYASGYAAGIDRGRQLEHDEVAAIQRECVRIVHELADVPPRDAEADRAAAERRAARWSA